MIRTDNAFRRYDGPVVGLGEKRLWIQARSKTWQGMLVAGGVPAGGIALFTMMFIPSPMNGNIESLYLWIAMFVFAGIVGILFAWKFATVVMPNINDVTPLRWWMRAITSDRDAPVYRLAEPTLVVNNVSSDMNPNTLNVVTIREGTSFDGE